MARTTTPPFESIDAYDAWFNDKPARQRDAEKAEQLLLFEMGVTPAKARTTKQIDKLVERVYDQGNCYNETGEWMGCMPDFDALEALQNLRKKVAERETRKAPISIDKPASQRRA